MMTIQYILFLALGVVIIFSLWMGRRYIIRIETELQKLQSLVIDLTHRNKDNYNSIKSAIEGATYASSLNGIGLTFPTFFGGPSIDPHHARALIHLLQQKKPRKILELGSGTSTILIARILELLDIVPDYHLSIDHEEKYLNSTIELAAINGLRGKVIFEHCPLMSISGYPNPWYSHLPELLQHKQIQFLLVDGPPAYESGFETARAPALNILLPFLTEDAVIILDDTNRRGESSVLSKWCADHPEFQVHRSSEGKGFAILTRQPPAA